MAEIEFSDNQLTMFEIAASKTEVSASKREPGEHWTSSDNQAEATIDWSFSTTDARHKLRRI